MDLLVHPGSARVADVGLQAGPGGQGPAPDHVRFHEHPGAVADGRHRLALLEEPVDELHRVVLEAQEVRVGYASGEHQRVVVGGSDLRQFVVHRERGALVHVVDALDLVGLGRDQLDGGVLLLQGLPGLGQLDLLHTIGGEERDLHACQLAGHGDSSSRKAESLSTYPHPFRR